MKKFIYGVLAFSPVLALAQIAGTNTTNLSGLSNLISSFGVILTNIIPILFTLAILYFFWGLVQFLRAAGDPKMADQGKSHMIYGVIAIAVMISIYGLVGWLQNTLGINSPTRVSLPTVIINS